LRHRKFSPESRVHPNVQQSSLGPSVEPPAQLPVDAPTVRARTSARRSTAGGQRAARHDRAIDRRTTLSSLVAELSAAAATIEDDIAASVVARLGTLDGDAAVAAPAVAPRIARTSAATARVQATASPLAHDDIAGTNAAPAAPIQMHLTGRRETPVQDSDAVAGEPASTSGDDAPRTTAQLEAARAEADVLFTRVSAEQAARAEAERRLADAQDELRFLRAEVQMTGHERRREPGPLRRALRTITGRRRPVVPANNPKKERLGV
jgi:hypothetical protein